MQLNKNVQLVKKCSLTFTSCFSWCTVTALVSSSRLVEWKSRSVSATLFKPIWATISETIVVTNESTFNCVKRLVPLVFVHRQFFGKCLITLTDIVAARVRLVCAFNRIVTISICVQVHSISDIFSSASTIIGMFVFETFVAVFEVEASLINWI